MVVVVLCGVDLDHGGWCCGGSPTTERDVGVGAGQQRGLCLSSDSCTAKIHYIRVQWGGAMIQLGFRTGHNRDGPF